MGMNIEVKIELLKNKLVGRRDPSTAVRGYE